jgi:hypothetical protein
LGDRNALVMLIPRRRKQREQLPATLTHAINHSRQIIDTVSRQLVKQCHLQRNCAKSLAGLAISLNAKQEMTITQGRSAAESIDNPDVTPTIG